MIDRLLRTLGLRPARRPSIYRQLKRRTWLAPPRRADARGLILHGASCSGKSHILDLARAAYPRLTCIEMDQARYWREDRIESLLAKFTRWFERWLREEHPACPEMVDDIAASEPSLRLTKMILAKACYNGRGFVGTCGNLPFPKDGFYAALEDLFRVKLTHVLVAPPEETFLARIEQRPENRMEQKEILLRSYRYRLSRRDEHDLVVVSDEEIDALITLIGDTIAPSA